MVLNVTYGLLIGLFCTSLTSLLCYDRKCLFLLNIFSIIRYFLPCSFENHSVKRTAVLISSVFLSDRHLLTPL